MTVNFPVTISENGASAIFRSGIIDAERAVLGSCYFDREAIAAVADRLEVDDFSYPWHRIIWSVMLALWQRKIPIDRLNFAQELEASGRAIELDMPMEVYAAELLAASPTSVHVQSYAYWVKKNSLTMQLQQASITRQVDVELLTSIVGQLRSLDQATSAPRYRFRTVDEIRSMPTPAWLIEGLLVENTLSCIYGTYGSFKSFVALDWALSIAGGHDWEGHAVQQRPVFYIAGEGTGGLGARIRAWENFHGRSAGDLPFYILDEAAQLVERGEVDAVIAAIMAHSPTVAPFIVIDTVARSMVGYDENSTRDMGLFVNAIERIQRETGGGHVCVVHHANASGTMRGNTALPAGVDTVIEVKRTKDSMFASLLPLKTKDRPPFDEIMLVSRVVEVDDDRNTSLVLVLADGSPSTPVLESDEQALAALEQAGDEGLTATEWEAASGLPRNTFYTVKKRLTERGVVMATGNGRGTRIAAKRRPAELDEPTRLSDMVLPWEDPP